MSPSLSVKQLCKLGLSLILLQAAAPLFNGAIVYGQSDCEAAATSLKEAQKMLADSPSAEDLQEIFQRLKYATENCPNNGDAWYYRAKVEQKLGKPSESSMKNAERYHSVAYKSGDDPFSSSILSTLAKPNQTTLTPNIRDTTPPRIKLISPPVTRGQGVSSGSRITVTGEATDESGVSEVTVRGQAAQLDGSGKFSAEVMLKVGDNQIAVTAKDIYGNRAEETFTIKRDVTIASGSSDSSTPSIGQYYALLISVEKYQDKRIPQLDNPEKDAARLAGVLTRSYSFDPTKVTTLTNPTREKILDTFDELKQKLTANDLLLIFYAGHGEWKKDKEQGYWLPQDARLDSTAQWISNGDLRDEIKGCKAKHVLLISDACFSGGLFRERSIPRETPDDAIREISAMPSRKAMTSGALKTVPDKSVFIEYLIKRLEENTQPFLSAMRLMASMQEAIINNSPNRQTPLYGAIQGAGDEGGDFVFMRRR